MVADSDLSFNLVVGAVVGVVVYFAPTIVAYGDKRAALPQIAALNLLAGWTFVGWVVALVWALRREAVAAPADATCRHCLSRVPIAAKVCRYCQRDL